MAFEVGPSHAQANTLSGVARNLELAKKRLYEYKDTIGVNWKSKEVQYISLSIDQTIEEINSAIRQLDGLAGDIKSVANDLRREDLEAEEAARRAAEEAARRAAEAALALAAAKGKK